MPERRPISEDVDALIVRTREAHEVLKDLKTVLREVQDTIKFAQEIQVKLLTEVAAVVDDAIGAAVDVGLENYSKSIENAIEHAESAVYRRFDIIAGILLGEQDEDGSVPMEDAARVVRKSMKKDEVLTPMETYFMDQIQETIRSRIGTSYTERP